MKPAQTLLVWGNGIVQNYSVIDRFPHVIIMSKRQGILLELIKNSSGNLQVLADIKSGDGKILARLNKNGVTINRNNTLEVKKTDSSVAVIDLYGKEIFSVSYINPRAIVMIDRSLPITGFSGNCTMMGSSGSDILID